MNVHTFEVDLDGKKLTLETGKIAKQASGSVVVRMGESVVLVSACAAPKPSRTRVFSPSPATIANTRMRPEKFPAATFKREGRMSEKETLTSRMIDRPPAAALPGRLPQ